MSVDVYAERPVWRKPRRKQTRAEIRAARGRNPSLAYNLDTEDALSDFLDSLRVHGGLPELQRWDPAGRLEQYGPDDLSQVVADVGRALLFEDLPDDQRAALRQLRDLALRCQTEGLFMDITPD